MLRLIFQRIALLIPILLGLSVLLFLWVRSLPGGPAAALLGERATPEAIEHINQLYGFDRPLLEQYITYIGALFQGNFGVSTETGVPVLQEFSTRFPATLDLAVLALIFAVAVGVPLGYLGAKHYRTMIDNLTVGASLLGVTVPVFFLAFILKYIFAVKLGWLPSSGREDLATFADHPTNFYVLDGIITGNFPAAWDALKHLILPAIALGSIPLAIIARMTRASVLEVKNADFVRTARAKGLGRQKIRNRYVLRNAMLPVVTIIGLQTGLLLSGAVLTETVFAFPGIGNFLYTAIFNLDYAVLQGFILFIAIIYALVNLFVDISYGLIDPRLRVAA